MRLHLYVFILASGGIAFAAVGNAQQPMPMPALLPPQPVITLTATASSQLANDRMHAFLRVDVDNPDPVAAGSEVNTRMAKALARAKAVRGVEAATTAYSSYQVSERNQPLRWRVSQTLSLESSDFTALAALVSKIQSEDGLVLGGMSFSVSPSARRTAEDALTQQAIKSWQARAQSGIKLRQPLRRLVVQGAERDMKLPTDAQLVLCKPFESIAPAECKVKRDLVFDYDETRKLFHINGMSFTNQTSTEKVDLGAVEEWSLTAANHSESGVPAMLFIVPFTAG